LSGSLQREIDALSRAHGIAELYVFGSRAAEIAAAVRSGSASDVGSSSPSDVDVGVRPLPGRDFDLDAVVKMTGALERVLDVARVDIVVLPRANPFLALDVIRGELLYAADSHDQAEYELYVLRRAGDLAPFQRARQELALDRYRER